MPTHESKKDYEESAQKVFIKTFGCPLVVAKTDYGENSPGISKIGMISIEYFYPTNYQLVYFVG